MLALLKIENLKVYAIVAGILFAIWFYKDWQFQKAENKRQTENIEQLRYFDSLKYASQTYSKKELNEYLEYNRQDLQQFLKDQKIATRKIERIITQKLTYQDNVDRSVNLQPILDAINKRQDIKIPVVDSTDCLIIKGYVAFENDTLSLNITDRKFKNKSDVVSYWQRNQWKILGIKTRLFGRKKATVIIRDNCGNTETFIINKKK